MSTFEQDFKEAIENLQEERKVEKKRPYVVHYCTTGTEPDFVVIARIKGGTSGRSVEVSLLGRDCKVIIPGTDIKKTFQKNELNGIIDCIEDFLENPFTD